MKKAYRSALHLAALLPLLALWAGCDSSSETTANLSGTVRDADDQTPLADVSVELGGVQATTDPNGRFELRDVPVGAGLVIRANAEGFDTYARLIDVHEGDNTHDIALSWKGYFTYYANREDSLAARFGVYLPRGVPAYRGVIFAVAPHALDSRPFASGDPMTDPATSNLNVAISQIRPVSLQLAEEYDLVLMGAQLTDYIQGDDIARALEDIARQTNHPELAQAPLLLVGFSWGGCFTYYFNARHYDRVLGFVAQKGNCSASGAPSDLGDVGAAKLVPGYLVVAEEDVPPPPLHSLTRAFEINRPGGALWAVAVEPGAGHSTAADANLVRRWMDAVLAARLPAAIVPGQPVVLPALDEASGWLGNRETHAIAPYGEYGGDPREASWLPTMRTAQDWQAFVTP